MSVLRPRNKLIYFRISEDEYQQISNLCEAGSARSISEVAREALHRLLSEDKSAPESKITERLQLLDAMIRELNDKLRRLDALLEVGNDRKTA